MARNLKDIIKFSINNKVEVLWKDGIYKSRIEDVSKESITINIPVNNGSYLTLSKNEMVEVVCYEGNEIYKFITTVQGRKFDRVPLIVLNYPTEVFEAQRRNHVRIPCVIDSQAYKLKDSTINVTNLKVNKEDKSKALLIDLSGGGAKFRTKLDLKHGDIIALYFTLNENDFCIKGKIVRSIKDDGEFYICGVSFMDMDSKTSDSIIRYIFCKMREQRKKV